MSLFIMPNLMAIEISVSIDLWVCSTLYKKGVCVWGGGGGGEEERQRRKKSTFLRFGDEKTKKRENGTFLRFGDKKV